MKTSVFLNFILAIALIALTIMCINQRKTIKEATPKAEIENEEPAAKEWHQIPIDSANLDCFKIFQDAAALNVGTPDSMNSMTIGWGSLGIIWGKDRHTITVYVRHSRFTHHLMEQNETFTVEAFAPEYADKLQYLGTASGRDENKMKGCGMTVKTMPCGAPAFDEGNLILECRKIFSTDYTTTQMDSTIVQRWYTKNDDFDNPHTAYVGEIIAVWVK